MDIFPLFFFYTNNLMNFIVFYNLLDGHTNFDKVNQRQGDPPPKLCFLDVNNYISVDITLVNECDMK